MIIKKGFLEILQLADSNEPRNFDDFTKISIARKLSSATVSKRLEELVRAAALEEVITKSKSGRRVIAYKTTEKGRKMMAMAKGLQEAVAAVKN